ncbi:aldo/keto reductase [Thermoleophilia bacterium SCSIO 60948]|nr:aldo/keto reductase [Thermoleophilia bacterium SCSIO 60948]
MTSSDTSSVPAVALNSGGSIPQLGFGVFQIEPEETEQAVAKAFEVGYRHVDTAQMYGNEVEVGTAIKASGLDRSEIFLTTKLNNDSHGFQKAKNALEESLSKLATEYVDLFLIHWPRPQEDKYVETWQAFEELQKEGKVREIGVSNFTPEHLDRLAAETTVVPAVNQIELHPFFAQHGLRREHGDRGIVTEAWSPIAQGGDLLEDQAVAEIAEARGKKPAQVILRWHVQLGNVIFPKSVTPERIEQNFEIFDFELSDEEMSTIDGLDRGERIGPDPDRFG